MQSDDAVHHPGLEDVLHSAESLSVLFQNDSGMNATFDFHRRIDQLNLHKLHRINRGGVCSVGFRMG